MNEKHINKKDETDQISLLTDVGENYEYLKTIIRNKVEIKKLEFLEKVSIHIGSIVWLLVKLALFVVISIFSLISLVLVLAEALESYLYAVLLVNSMMILLLCVIYLFVKPLIIKKTETSLLKMIED